MSWTKLASISLLSSSKIVAVLSGDTANVKVGDALQVAGFDLVEVIGVRAEELILRDVWMHNSIQSSPALIIPTSGDFNQAARYIRELSDVTVGNMASMEKWWTDFGVVEFSSYDGVKHFVKTAKEMNKIVDDLQGGITPFFMADCAVFCKSQHTLAIHIHSYFMLNEKLNLLEEANV